MTRRVVVSHIQRLGDLAFDSLGAFQAQHKTLGLAACAVEVFFRVSTGDGVEELDGVRAYAFGEADLVDAHVRYLGGLKSVARETTAGVAW